MVLYCKRLYSTVVMNYILEKNALLLRYHCLRLFGFFFKYKKEIKKTLLIGIIVVIQTVASDKQPTMCHMLLK